MTRRPLPASARADALEQALRGRGALLRELELGPLDSDALAKLVREVASLHDDHVAQTVAAAEGNALLAIERARALARGRSEPPATLRAAVRTALAPLSPEPRLVAEFAAAASRELAREELEALPVASTDRGRNRVAPDRPAGRQRRQARLPARATARSGLRRPPRSAPRLAAPAPRRSARETRRRTRARRRGRPAPQLAGRSSEAAGHLARAAKHARSVAALEQAAAFLHEAIDLRGEDARAARRASRGRGMAATSRGL